ncbi:MAG: hypothetical protein RDV48_23225 [Candidatus Eremiobacteraeota bacterium]|nr:hypothetical protein [Candidatus Eremiobacteraeota bacterium]
MSIKCKICDGEMENQGSLFDLCVCGGDIIKSFWSCPLCGKLFYNEYYDCWNSDSPDDVWFEVSRKAFDEGLETIRRCPDNTSKFCACEVHPFSVDYGEVKKV